MLIKACQKDDIPTKVIKMNKDIFAGFIVKDFNNCVDKGAFPDKIKKRQRWLNQLQACKYTVSIQACFQNIWKINQ